MSADDQHPPSDTHPRRDRLQQFGTTLDRYGLPVIIRAAWYPLGLANPDAFAALRARLLTMGELLIVVLWAMAFTTPYLNFHPYVVPIGREFSATIQMHHIWLHARECGTCALWYGQAQGGFPAFADPIASVLHPLVIVTTLLWGVVNGAKVALVASFAMAGLAQWWLAQVLGLGRVARLWSACMVVVSGHIAARMNLGAFNMVLSTAACCLVVPALVRLCQTGSRRSAVILGITMALAGISGNGYLQVGLAFVMPATLFLLPADGAYLLRVLRRFGLALGLALLLAAPFLVPYLHFQPTMAKDFDLSFGTAQPLAYMPLNLVIDDLGFYTSESLQKAAFPSHYINYIGWLPVLLALWGLFGVRRHEGRTVVFLSTMALLGFWVASAQPLRWLVGILPPEGGGEFLGGLRYTSIMVGIALPPILTLAALGIERLLNNDSLKLRLGQMRDDQPSGTLRLDLRWLLVLPLGLALSQAWTFNRQWINVEPLPAFVPEVLEALEQPDLQWVDVPIGQHFYIEPAVAEGLKLSNDFFRTWSWRDADLPPPVLEAHVDGVSPGMAADTVVAGININIAPDNPTYARVIHSDGSRTDCSAQGIGGQIDVTCTIEQPGILTISEHAFSGWTASMGQRSIPLRSGPWLSVEVPAGTHTIAFRYQPWDVPLGWLLWLIGLVLAGWVWWRGDNNPQRHRPIAEEMRGETSHGEHPPANSHPA